MRPWVLTWSWVSLRDRAQVFGVYRGNIMWKLFVFCFAALTVAKKASFENYEVFRVVPASEKQVTALRQLDNTDGISFWIETSYVNQPVDIMVAPHKLPEFQEIMKEIGLSYETYIENVQSLIDNEQSPEKSDEFNFSSYHTLDQIYEYLDSLAVAYPDKVQVVVGGKTYEGRQIKGVKVTFAKDNPGIFIEGGIHAREWISPATVLYLLNAILTSHIPAVRELAESHNWYFFPSFNPDGYVYTHTTNRLWRKTRKPYTYLCYGTDPNRNWNYKWMQGGASRIPCAETYAGPTPFSDIETKTMSEFIKAHKDEFYAYISFHSYSQLLLFPYGHTKDHLENYDELYAIGKKATEALEKKHGTKYVVGNIAETIYIATGSSVDYVKGLFGKPITYTYELRDRGAYGFLLPANQIIPTGEETLDSLVAMFKEAKERGHPRNEIW
ncbi:hypothetical protein KM043_013980 [Ampulex compressa]|nr:hypothetical protein KM043_013980 [Ampulex compressa]